MFYQYESEVRYNDKIVLLFTCCQMFLIEKPHVHSFFIRFKEEVLKVELKIGSFKIITFSVLELFQFMYQTLNFARQCI